MKTTLPRSAAAVAGIGSTRFGLLSGQTSYSLGAAALREALDDAALRADDIDGLIVCRIPDYQRFGEINGLNPVLALPLPGQGRMSAVAIETAVAAISSGLCEVVALVYGNDGKSAGARYGGTNDTYGSGGAEQWFPFGMTSPGAAHAMMYSAYAHRYGTRPEQLGEVARTFREHAAHNPAAVMRKPFSIDEYLASRYIAEPLRLLDYCLINDGGVALIITSAARARDLRRKPVYVRGLATRTTLSGSTFPADDGFWRAALQEASSLSFEMAGLGRQDIQALMIYDNFTPTVLFSLEGCGYCGPGEAAYFVGDGHLALGGRYPANTHGGHLSESYMQGWGHYTEAVRQLRGTCGTRQISDVHHVHYICASPIGSSIIFSDIA